MPVPKTLATGLMIAFFVLRKAICVVFIMRLLNVYNVEKSTSILKKTAMEL